jgi:hypothetical protein
VAVGTTVRLGVGVSVGNIFTAPTHEVSKNPANIIKEKDKRLVLMMIAFDITLWACEVSP